MNIAYIHTGQWPSNSPSFTFVTSNAIGLASQFDNVYLMVKDNCKRETEEILETELQTERPKNLKIIRKNIHSALKSNYFYARKVVPELKEIIADVGLDAIVTRSSRMLKFLMPFKEKYNVPVFYEAHDFYADLSIRNDINKKKKSNSQKYERKFVSKVSGILCLQNSQRELYNKAFPNVKTYLARTGIQKIINENSKSKYITYIGSLEKHKGLLQLLKSLSISKSKPQLLVIGGKNENEINELNKMISKHYFLDKVTITGWLNKKKLKELLLETAVGIVPLSDTFFNRYLTSPLKLFDYYSFSIPVIATDLNTTRELIDEGKTGYFFEDGNNVDLANKIDELFENKSLINEMRTNVFEYSQNLLWEKRAEVIKDIIKHRSEDAR